MKKFILSSILLFVLVFASYQLFVFFSENPASTSEASSKATPAPQPKPEPKVVRVAAMGDIMMHSPQLRAGQRPGGKYDFRHFFKEVKPYIESADLAIGNLETTLAGKAKPYSGYPQFNAPDELIDALKYAGVDLVSTSNNHAMDTGEKGVIRTYQTVNKKGIKSVGTAPTAEQRHATFVEKNGIKFAFLAYTEHTNGLPVPKDKPYLINRINTKQIAQDIKEAREQGAEFVSVSLHFGQEYQRQPNEFQRKTARQILEDGADVILGSHPHVLQPIEKVNINGQEKLIIYSMGNFISNQTDPYTDEGVILYFDVVKDPEKEQISLKNVSFLPTYVHKYQANGKSQYVVIPTEKSTPAKLPKYPSINATKWKSAWTHTYAMMRKNGEFPTFSLNEQ